MLGESKLLVSGHQAKGSAVLAPREGDVMLLDSTGEVVVDVALGRR